MWKINGNFHPGCGGLKVVRFGNKDGSQEKPIMTGALDGVCYADFVILEDGGRFHHFDQDPVWHVYLED